MELTEENLDVSLELALRDLKKNLDELGDSGAVSKLTVLQKTREALKNGKINLLVAGVIEGRLNHNLPLEKSHRAVLGLVDSTKIEGLESPKQSAPAVRMGGKAPGGSGISMTGAPSPSNPIVEAMQAKGKMNHSYQAPDGTVNIVSGSEILKRCQERVRSGVMSLMRSGDVERMVNSGLPIRPEVLREIFA